MNIIKSLLFAGCSLLLVSNPAFAVNISSGGVDGPDGGLLKIEKKDPYWWFCVQPDGSRGPLFAGPVGYEADIVTLEYGWTHQALNRFTFAGNAPEQAQNDLARQVNVIEYVLDRWLPWEETNNNFLNKVGDPAASTNQASNDNFFNRYYAAQQFIKKLYNKIYDDNNAFQDLSVFNPENPFSTTNGAADLARHDFFESIKQDAKSQALDDFFFSYAPEHLYNIVNTSENQYLADGSTPNPADWQDAIIIGYTDKIPEPATSALAVGSLLMLGRRRTARHSS